MARGLPAIGPLRLLLEREGTKVGDLQKAHRGIVQAIGQALVEAFNMFWEALWPLILGFGPLIEIISIATFT